MKSMTKLMLVAMVLAAALVVAPAAAARNVSNGDTIYVGETGLNLTSINASGTSVATLVYYSNVASATAGTIGDTIDVSNSSSFELLPTSVGTLTGAWYAFPSGGALTNPNDALGYVRVQIPSTKLNVYLDAATLTDSVDKGSVTRDSVIKFQIEHNVGALPSPDGNMTIEVTTPNGGKLETFGANNVDLSQINLTSTQKKSSGAISLTGLAAGPYMAQAKWPSGSDFYGKGYNSNTVTFEILSKAIGITSSKDNVVRGNNFVVTINGESKETYYVYVKDASVGANEYPLILGGQPKVQYTNVIPKGASVVFGTKANVTTDAAGIRTVEFNTTTLTKDRQFTIRVENQTDSTKYDEVKVRVEKGGVIINAAGTGVYYIGEEITLYGTCTDNDTVHLFLTGPNLYSNGVSLKSISTRVVDGNDATFATETTKSDDTWSLKWDTSGLARSLDAGGYTIYAAAQPQGKNNLSGVQYAVASVQLRSAYVTASSSGAIVAKGDDLKLAGTAQGNPSMVRVWIFGKNFYGIYGSGTANTLYDTATVESDGSFEYEFKDTGSLSAGQYYAVIQHPMTNGFGVETDYDPSTGAAWIYGDSVKNATLTNLQASAAATALIDALDSPNIDDTYVKLTFVVEEAQIFIDAIGDKAAGSTFTITGTTNLAVGDTLNIEVTSAAFQPTSKTEASGFGSISGVEDVKQGDGANTWSFEVDGSSFKPDQYIVKVESVDTDTTSTANFNVVEAVPTTQATPTATATGEVTPTATATTEATPTQSPGFGALLALAGLGAVAFLVLRRD